ncbi:hypothetical protein EVG20_g6458 [Dentipellis fragilis]|uniref:Uncharacterized protein n=1 Tax=Dentipellis fragilis TaxID=205917 RepID=A0A4Y9YKN9_9AGAM|nr:hypothetical protein EVG20_g6458 [Dentipellis fragilis]
MDPPSLWSSRLLAFASLRPALCGQVTAVAARGSVCPISSLRVPYCPFIWLRLLVPVLGIRDPTSSVLKIVLRAQNAELKNSFGSPSCRPHASITNRRPIDLQYAYILPNPSTLVRRLFYRPSSLIVYRGVEHGTRNTGRGTRKQDAGMRGCGDAGHDGIYHTTTLDFNFDGFRDSETETGLRIAVTLALARAFPAKVKVKANSNPDLNMNANARYEAKSVDAGQRGGASRFKAHDASGSARYGLRVAVTLTFTAWREKRNYCRRIPAAAAAAAAATATATATATTAARTLLPKLQLRTRRATSYLISHRIQSPISPSYRTSAFASIALRSDCRFLLLDASLSPSVSLASSTTYRSLSCRPACTTPMETQSC